MDETPSEHMRVTLTSGTLLILSKHRAMKPTETGQSAATAVLFVLNSCRGLLLQAPIVRIFLSDGIKLQAQDAKDATKETVMSNVSR